MASQTSAPTPEHFFTTVNAYQQTAAVKAAIELDLFTAIAEGNTTVKQIAESRQASERGMRILCDYLVIIGFLTKTDGRYGLLQDSALFLDRRSPAYLGGALEFLLSPTLLESFNDLADVVRKGRTIASEGGTVSPEHPVWVRFARGMAPMMIMPGQEMAGLVRIDPDKKVKILDIAAGHGIFGISFAQRYPNVEVTAVDWAPVLEVATENAKKFGVAERHHKLPGSAFEVDYGTGYDLVLLTNFLHHFDIETNQRLLKKVHASLVEGGRAVTLEFVPNEDRVSPPSPAAFSMTMLASTPSGDAYTFVELEKLFSYAGFKRSELHQLTMSPEQVVVSEK